MTAMDTFTEAVEKAGLKVENHTRDSFMVECPSHADNNPSVSVRYTNGKVILMDHAGCDTRDIIADLGLEMSDLFDEEPDREKNNMVVATYSYFDPYTMRLAFKKERIYPKSFRIYREINGQRENGLGGEKPYLYNADGLKAAIPAGEPVWIVEGEADCEAMKHMGATATTQPHGAGPGKWLNWHTNQLRNAKEVRIVVDLDDDHTNKRGEVENTGRDYAFQVRDSLVAAGIKVTLWKTASGKDASDHLKAGYGLSDFKKYDLGRLRVKGTMGGDLMSKEFPPLVWAVEGILPQGVCLLAAPPKAGKSWMTVDIAVAVASGGKALGRIPVTQGDVLYIGLEDSERRLQERISLLCDGHMPDMSRIEFQTIDSNWEGGDRGMAGMREWASDADDPRLVVIDTLRKHEPQLDEARNAYLAEQELMLRYKRFADQMNLTVLFVHHDSKAEDGGDWLNRFSGSKGLTGGADTLWLLDHKRGEREGFLRIEGRDVIADDLPIHKASGRPFWVADECPTDASELMDMTPHQRKIMAFVREGGGVRAMNLITIAFPVKETAEAVGLLVRQGLLAYDPEIESVTL